MALFGDNTDDQVDNSSPNKPESKLRKVRKPSDEIDPETGEAYQDIPGVEYPDEFKVGESLALSAASGAGALPGVMNAAQGAAKRSLLSKLKDKMPGQQPTGSDINSMLKDAHPMVQQQALANPDRLSKEGQSFLRELESKRVAQTEGNALSSIGARSRDQQVPVNSNPSEGPALNYAEINKPTQRPDSGFVANYNNGRGASMRRRRPGETN